MRKTAHVYASQGDGRTSTDELVKYISWWRSFLMIKQRVGKMRQLVAIILKTSYLGRAAVRLPHKLGLGRRVDHDCYHYHHQWHNAVIISPLVDSPYHH